MPRKIEISHRTVIFTVFFLVFLWFLFYIREIILVFFIALLIMTILNPLVSRLSKFKIPRGVSVFLVYILSISILIIAIAGIVPPLIEQTTVFANKLPGNLENLGISSLVSDQVAKEFLSQVGGLPGQLVKIGVTIFSNILAVLTILIIAFYLLVARDKLDDQLAHFFGGKEKKRVGELIDTLEVKLGGWARGELILMAMVGLMTFFGLTLLGVPFALPLSILAGLLEMAPNVGPIIAMIPMAFIGFGVSPVTGLATIALAFLVQQIENYFLVPKVMEKSVGVSPIYTLLSLAVGFKVAGVVGILISVPVFITVQVLVKEYFFSK